MTTNYNLWTGPFTPLSTSKAVEYDAGSACDGLVNLTPHPLNVDFGGGFVVNIPSHGVARVSSEPLPNEGRNLTLWVPHCLAPARVQARRYINDVKVTVGGQEMTLNREPYFAPVEPAEKGMWPRENGPRIYFVVSLLTGLALPGHPTLLVPGPEIRNKEGQIIGCEGLARIV